MQRIVLGLLLLLVGIPGIAAGRDFYQIETKSGETYYPMRMSMFLQCPGGVPRTVGHITRVFGDSEQQGDWDSLPDFFMEWDDDRRGYVLLSNEERPEKREVLGYVDIHSDFRGSSCRHYMKVEALGGIVRNVPVNRVQWPIVVRKK